jgi:hypothetical protein
MIAATLFVLVSLGVPVPWQKDPAMTSRYGEWTGTVQTGIMAIGGETTGMRLMTGADQLELTATDAVLERLRALNGQQVTLLGRLDTRAGVEIRTRRIITVTEVRRPSPPVQRRTTPLLYRMFFGRTEWPERVASLPVEVQPEFQERYARRRALSPAPGARPDGDMETYRLDLQAALTAYSGPFAAKEAAAYAKDAKLFREWEGYPDSPFDEAASAEKYLAAQPKTPLRPYLELFVLDRLRAAFEAAIRTAELPDKTFPLSRATELRTGAATKYRAVWERINASADPLTKALAADIDSATYNYIDVAAHPRK